MVVVGVLVKQVPDVESIRLDPKTSHVDVSQAPLRISDYDKNALEAALQIKEKVPGSKILVFSVGGTRVEETVREALSLGCDEGVVLKESSLDLWDTALKAEALASMVRKVGSVDLILAAEESADNHSAQTGPRVAEILGWPLVAYATSLEISGKTLRIERDVDEGREVVEVDLPAVVTTTESLNTPRLPTLMQILQSKSKPMRTFGASELGLEGRLPLLSRVRIFVPKNERKQILIDSPTPEEAATKLAQILVREGVVE